LRRYQISILQIEFHIKYSYLESLEISFRGILLGELAGAEAAPAAASPGLWGGDDVC
jgi:hypothetical protein